MARTTRSTRKSPDSARRGSGKAAGRGARRTAAPKPRPRSSGRAGRPGRGRWLKRLAVWSLVLVIWLGVAGAAVIGYYAYDLPDMSRLAESTRRPNVSVLAADGSTLAAFGDLYGEAVRVRTLPPHVPQAVLAVEDRRFYRHPGFDVRGLARAVYVNLRAGRLVQGGSTITQQLAKVLFLKPDRTIKRKVQELLLALWLERRFTKDQILSLYLNRVYLGAGTYGWDAAAQRFFGKSAKALNLYEAALLAGLIKAPSRYNPARSADLAESRALLALDAMVEAGFITADQKRQAAAQKSSGRGPRGRYARHFADWILSLVPSFVGAIDRDLVVETTLDPKLQRIAEQETRALLAAEGAVRKVDQAALVALAPNGAVRAMVGGRNYGESQFNRAAQALRQPGSAFKPFVYLAAVEGGFRPDDRMVDKRIKVGSWRPKNYGGRYYGEVTLREAFARSLNSVAVQLAQKVGPARIADAARRMGITSDIPSELSIALGTAEVTLLELTGAYAVLANRGHGVWPFGIERITDRSGRILYHRTGVGPGRVLTGPGVNNLTDLMTASVAWGTGKAAAPGRPAAGKTGTSQDFRDAWFVGFTADLVAGVWLGNDDGSAMDKVTGGTLPARLWSAVMRRGFEGVPPRPLAPVSIARSAPKPTWKPSAESAARTAPEVAEDPGDDFIGRILKALTSVFEDDGEDPGRRRFPGDDRDGGPRR